MSQPALPGHGPWFIRLSPSDTDPGVFAVQLMDPTAGGAQAGPFRLMFPTADYAMEWFTAFVQPDDDATTSDLERGSFVSGTANPAIWGPMISVLFHSAEVTHHLGSPWWYGSSPNWAEVNPLLPPMTHAAELILAAEQTTPELDITPLLGTCLLILNDEDPDRLIPLSKVGLIEYPDEDDAANYVVVVWPLGGEPQHFMVDGSLEGLGTRTGPYAFMSEGQGRVTIRLPESTDGPRLSHLRIELPEDVLHQLLILREEAASKGGHVHEALIAVDDLDVFDADEPSVYGLYYRLTGADDTARVWWFDGESWLADELPLEAPQWLAMAAKLGFTPADVVGNRSHEVSLTVAQCGEHLEVQAHAISRLLQRYRERLPIDSVMLVLAMTAADERLCPETLREPFGSAFRDAIDTNPFVLAEADPMSRELASLGPDHQIAAEWLLELYVYLVGGNARIERN